MRRMQPSTVGNKVDFAKGLLERELAGLRPEITPLGPANTNMVRMLSKTHISADPKSVGSVLINYRKLSYDQNFRSVIVYPKIYCLKKLGLISVKLSKEVKRSDTP